MNIFSACQETHCEGFFSWMSLLCLLFNSLHRRWQLPPRCHRSGLNLCLRERWQHRFNTAFLSIMLSICFLFPLRLSEGGFVSGRRRLPGELAHTHKSYRHNGGVNTHSSVVLMAAFCWRGDWIRPGADCSAHWLMLPAALQCVTALRVLLLNANETPSAGTIWTWTTQLKLNEIRCYKALTRSSAR